jgi:hypothetical protein
VAGKDNSTPCVHDGHKEHMFTVKIKLRDIQCDKLFFHYALVASRVFNGISFREIFAKRKRNEFRNFAKIKNIFAKFRVSRKCHFSENKRNETKRNETKQTKRNAVKLCETKKTFKVREGKKQLYKCAHIYH